MAGAVAIPFSFSDSASDVPPRRLKESLDLSQSLPPQLRPLLEALARVVALREAVVRRRVDEMRAANPETSQVELAHLLIRATRRRVAATGAVSGAAAIAPGLGTVLALGTVTSQALYGLEQEVELVMAIAILFGHDLTGSDERLLEALLVLGLAGGAVQLRENVLVAGGQQVTVLAFRQLPHAFMAHAGAGALARVLGRAAGSRAAAAAARVAPFAVGMAVGAGFDWLAVSALGRAALRYYGPGGPVSHRPQLAGPGEETLG